MGKNNKMNSVEKSKEIYQKAFDKYGDDTKSCLWDKPMIMRYEKLCQVAPLENRSVLDLGCGLGGLYDFVVNNLKVNNIKYKGIDLIDGMIQTASGKYPDAHFETRDIFQNPIQEKYDYVFMCGVFNVKIGDDIEFMKKMLKSAYDCCNKGIAFNFISSKVNFTTEGTQYHDPIEVMKFCIENLSWKVSMDHHYEKCDVSVFVYR